MADCDMCGKEAELFVTRVEGTELMVCSGCAAFGTVIRKVARRPVVEKKVKRAEPEVMEVIVSNYDHLIRQKREKRSLTQEELAKKINEKVSVIHKIETRELEPSIALAHKLGKFLGLTLVSEYTEEHTDLTSSKTESFTLGDFIKVKEKKD